MTKIDIEIERRVVRKYSRDVSLLSIESKTFDDDIVVEQPLEIRINTASQALFQNLVVMMRTPGRDHDLVRGFLFTEGIIQSLDQIIEIKELHSDVVGVTLHHSCKIDKNDSQRQFFTSSSCGVCSKDSAAKLHPDSVFLAWTSKLAVSSQLIFEVSQIFELEQLIFSKTGGNHATALLSNQGKLIEIAEDVGRHNAMDKIIGFALASGLLALTENILVVSGRLSFELVQKAGMAGVPIIVALGAPSSYAIEEAAAQNIAIIGFAKDRSFNVYTALERIKK